MAFLADELRGHDWLPDDLSAIPALYETEATPLPNKCAHLRFFVGACSWHVMELDPDTGIAFGWADLGDPVNAELGYFSLHELRDIAVRHPSGAVLVVERDLHFTPKPFAHI